MTPPATHDTSLTRIHRLVWIALMAALTTVGAMISVPIAFISPVPVSLQTMFVLLAGLILGPRDGALAMLLYLAAGCVGLPVFAGGKAGLASFLGPTGGFLIGFIPSAVCAGFAGGQPVKPLWKILFWCTLATALTLITGAARLAMVLHLSPGGAIALGVTPFLPGAVAKILAAALIYKTMAMRRLVPA